MIGAPLCSICQFEIAPAQEGVIKLGVYPGGVEFWTCLACIDSEAAKQFVQATETVLRQIARSAGEKD